MLDHEYLLDTLRLKLLIISMILQHEKHYVSRRVKIIEYIFPLTP